jgi:signal transduction histidine kinase
VSLLFAGAFTFAAVVLLFTFNLSVHAYAERSVAAELRTEMDFLLRQVRPGDPDELTEMVVARQQNQSRHQYGYLLLDPNGRRIAGRLPIPPIPEGASEVLLAERPGRFEFIHVPTTIHILSKRLPDGSVLSVGRDTEALDELEELIDRWALGLCSAIAVLAVIVGYFQAAAFVRQLDRVVAATERIMDGRLDERLPQIGGGDEFERLSGSLNSMLERIELLMASVRQISTDVAHELRTPLTRLRQGLERSRAARTRKDVDAAIEDALGQLDGVMATFSAVLRIGQIEAGAARSRFRSVNLSVMVEEVAGAYHPAAEDRGKTLISAVADGVHVTGDRDLLAQALANLIENALIHSNDAPQINVALVRQGEMAVMSVSDSGPGVDPAEIPNISRRFYRVDASRSTPGAGLGLSLVTAIAELHHCHLQIENLSPGLCASIRMRMTA